jgi:protein-tyrosine phosphatase
MHDTAGGVSRSSAVVVAYIMRTELMSLACALSYIRERHPAAAPNSGFIHQLMALEKRLGVADAQAPSFSDLSAAGNM